MSHTQIQITFVAQPPCSPDLNACDLGALYSIASGVRDVFSRTDPDKKMKPETRIIQAIKDRWSSWDATTRLQNIFDTKVRTLQSVIDECGSNEFTIPRSGKSHVGDAVSWLPPAKA